MNLTYNDLLALYEIARVVASEEDIQGLMSKVLNILSEKLGMNRGMISVLDLQSKEVWLDIARGVEIGQEKITYRPGEGITGIVAQTGRPMAIANLGKETHFLDRTGARSKINRKELSFLCVPIFFKGKVVGILSADKLSREVEDLDKELELLSSVAHLLGKAVYFRAVEEENRKLRKQLATASRPKTNIIGRSKGILEVLKLIDQVANTDTTVLITGETGTGKELVASAIHENSSRAKGPYIKVNCAAMPESLLESELFGHEKGAFTGALSRRKGCFQEANKGTIFLDEIGELSPMAQAKLLRVLQDKEIQPVGASRTIKVDVRVIAATNKDLEQEVAKGRFRSDLFFRLNIFPIYIPPLRERGSDILLLADFFVNKYSKIFKKNIKRISTSAIDMLMSYHWPGNVRELENCIERAVLIAEGETIESHHLPPSLQTKSKSEKGKFHGKFDILVANFEKDLIIDALKETNGNQSSAAKILGTTKRIIQYKIKKYGIDPKRFKKKK